MKKFLTSLFGVILVIGVLATVMSFSDAMIVLSGNKVSLNEATKKDFADEAVVEGEIFYVYDQIAVEEVTRTKYGIETGSTKTYFYLIESYDKQWFDDEDATYEPLTLIYATADEDEMKKLDKMVDDWYAFDEAYADWYSDETATEADFPAFPENTIQISGIITEASDDDIIKYRDEYIGDYLTDDVDTYINDYCVNMIIENRSLSATKYIFFGGIAGIIIGLVGLIITLIKNKKSTNTPPENVVIDETPSEPINE